MTGEELRERINKAIPTSDLDWPGDDVVSAAVARAIVDALGITREMVEQVTVGSWLLEDEQDRGTYWADEVDDEETTIRPDHLTAKRAADALTALLDASEEP